MPPWSCGSKFKSRERKTTYKGVLRAKFVYQLNDGPEQFDIKELGEIPVMVKVQPLQQWS
jgi:DNA-directed RNA polymerase beta subunit